MSTLLAGIQALGAAAQAINQFARDHEAGGGMGAPDPVLVELANRIDNYEDAEYHRLSPSVGGLYIHWFFSLLALIECIVRLLLYGIIIFIWSLFIYLSCCLSCGKTINAPSEPFMMAAVSRYSIYSAFTCALVSNVLCPFAPALYFWKRRVTIIRPPGMVRHRPLAKDPNACCTCSDIGGGMFLHSGIDVPVWKMLEIYISTVAVLHILGGGCSAWSSLCEFKCWLETERYLAWAVEDVTRYMAQDTAIFYNKAYSVTSFESFMQARYPGRVPAAAQSFPNPSVNAPGGGGGYLPPQHQQMQQQQYQQQYQQQQQQYQQQYQQQQQQQQYLPIVAAEAALPGAATRGIPIVHATPMP